MGADGRGNLSGLLGSLEASSGGLCGQVIWGGGACSPESWPQDTEGHQKVSSCHSVPILTPLADRWGARVGAPRPSPLAPPASPTVTNARAPAPPPPIDSARLCPSGLSFSAGPWKSPCQRPPLSGPARHRCSQDWTKPARSQPPGRMERFSVWIIQPQKACGPFASISWTRRPRPGEKIPTGPKAGVSPGKIAALASDTPCPNPGEG